MCEVCPVTCTHDPLTLTATVLVLSGLCSLTVLGSWLAIHAADALWAFLCSLWARLGRAEEANR